MVETFRPTKAVENEKEFLEFESSACRNENATGLSNERYKRLTLISHTIFTLLYFPNHSQPKQFLTSKPFVLTFAVYFGTYAVANLSELALDANKVTDDERRKQLKVSAASVANISLLAWRDAIFAQDAAASGAVKPKTPMRSLGLFAVRDASTMYATFYVAPNCADFLIKEHGVERNTAELGCALAIPMVTQIITAPVHIHAMDYFNKPNATMAERIGAIKSEFSTVSFARGLRILPAFGIGSFSNNKFRELFIRQTDEEKLLQRRVTAFIETRITRRQAA